MPRSGGGRDMGFDFGLNDPNSCFKRKNRWLLKIEDICANGINSLPPNKSARPTISFKEIEIQHLTETIYFPGKPDFKPLNLTLYDLQRNEHPIFNWLKELYDVELNSQYYASCDGFKKAQARLELYDGCGIIQEAWVYESIWPQSVDFGELDMATSDIITCDVVLRYDRAYLERIKN